jgi:UDP-2-acetamido-2,6-beta-L-arabino-hexul-4-ose reductase
MVIGDGMVAQNFKHYQEREDVIIFASGVSNSKLAISSEFDREKSFLKQTLVEFRGTKLVYFSTFNLYDPQEQTSAYCLHKLNIEDYIGQHVPKYNIFRLGHVAGNSVNQSTILNFLYDAIKNETPFKLWKNASRNIIDIDDINKLCSYIIDNDLYINQITNISNTYNTSLPEIVQTMEEITGKKGRFTIIEGGGNPEAKNTDIQPIAQHLGILFDDSYAKRVIYKYYQKL